MRDLPRLSVDIDLVFLPLHERKESLAIINAALECICDDLQTAFPDVNFIKPFLNRDDALRLTVIRSGIQIKIELSPAQIQGY